MLMNIYDNSTTLSLDETCISLGTRYITTTFNVNTKTIHVKSICIFLTLSILMFLIHFQKFLDSYQFIVQQ
jgi:hypothetical protein